MDVLVSQVVTMIILLTLSLAIGMIPALLVGPLQLRTNRVGTLSTNDIISVLSCFGGGVFFATCFLDLVPNVRESVSIALSYSNVETDFPVADFIIAMGLFMILIIEQTALTFKQSHDVDPHARYHGHGDEGRPLLESAGSQYCSSTEQNLTAQVEGASHVDNSTHDDSNRGLAVDATLERTSSLEKSNGGNHSSHAHSSIDSSNGDDCHQLHSPSKLRSLLLLGALSIHSVFEGLAIGIQETENDVWTLSVAVFIHKSILAFSLGVNFLKTGMSKMGMFQSLILFSLMAPVGITIGIIITEEFSQKFQQSIANGSLQGLATGTFLYITFFEVLPHEMSTPKNRLLKVLSIVLGFSVICLLILLFSQSPSVDP